jgi:hypothetical protein
VKIAKEAALLQLICHSSFPYPPLALFSAGCKILCGLVPIYARGKSSFLTVNIHP